jgi:hypothetical protein
MSTGAGEGDNAFGHSQGPDGLTVWGRDNSLQPMGVSRSPAGLDLHALNPNVSAKGWAVYTFKRDGIFTVTPGSNVPADVLLVGGGGSSGGGMNGGGGGAGGFVDKHDIIIYHDGSSAPHGGGYPDGEVLVGAGGATVPASASEGNTGGESKLGAFLLAHGGGYGGRVGRPSVGCPDYPAGDGASGGGGQGHEIFVETIPYMVDIYTGIPGEAVHNPEVPEGADARDYEEGHDGGVGGDQSPGGNHSSGGGGGAQWPAYDGPYSTGGTRMTGGLGRPCDIGGWYQNPDSLWGGLYKEVGMTYVPWFAGGGAGKERDNLWGYNSGYDGYAGGGSTGEDGEPNTGGGGGGHGWAGADTPEGESEGTAPGRAGGSGIVIVRIPLGYKQYVTAPLQLTDDGQPRFTQVWDAWWEVYNPVPVYPSGVTYHEVPLDEPHLDQRGDSEPAYIWGSQYGGHFHRWGWVDGDFVEV